jgi:integrase
MTTTRHTRMPRFVPVADWPEPDRQGWSAAQAPSDLLDDPGAAAHWRPASIAKTEKAVGRFFGWALDEAGLPLAPIPRLATTDHVRAYIAWLSPRLAPLSVLGLMVDLAAYMRVVWPTSPRTHLERATAALQRQAKPVRDKASRLRPTEELVRFGEDLMRSADQCPRNQPVIWLPRFRDGLAIALLALRPLRVRAFVSLQLDEHVRRLGDRWRLIVTPDLSKTHRHWEADVPKRLAAAFERYVQEVRPQLLVYRGRPHGNPVRALWVSIDGLPFSPNAMSNIITKRTRMAFGTSLPPHFFRDCAATTLAFDSPASVQLATPLLGHADPRTTQEHYNQAQSLDAGRRHLAALRTLRRPRA